MKRSTNRILTSHVGSLIRPPALQEFLRAKQAGKPYVEKAYQNCLADSVGEVVREQAQAGIDQATQQLLLGGRGPGEQPPDALGAGDLPGWTFEDDAIHKGFAFAGFQLTPSEFAKIALIAVTASVLSAKWRKLGDVRQLALPLAPIVVVVAGIVIMQRDLGTTVILCGTVFLMLFAAGVRGRHLTVVGLAGLLATALLTVPRADRDAEASRLVVEKGSA